MDSALRALQLPTLSLSTPHANPLTLTPNPNPLTLVVLGKHVPRTIYLDLKPTVRLDLALSSSSVSLSTTMDSALRALELRARYQLSP
jgi:hypothetical protein